MVKFSDNKSDMKELKTLVMGYLFTGHSPTVVSFPDDGLPELYSQLNADSQNRSGYDPAFTFLPVSLKYIEHLSPATIEAEINDELCRDSVPGDTILETINNGYDIAVVLDDLDLLSIPAAAAEMCDAIIKKYRNRVRFIYLIENVSLLSKLRHQIPSYSSIIDAVIYKPVGRYWSQTQLAYDCKVQFGEKLEDEIVDELAEQSNMHYGIFKRAYRDKLFDTKHLEEYITNLLSEFSLDEINTLKKVVTGAPLSVSEQEIKKLFENVNLIDNGKVTIPVLEEAIRHFRIKGKVGIEKNKRGKETLNGIDLDLLARSEREIIAALLKHQRKISREHLAEVIWKEHADAKYSEWAIDKRVSRLRKKMQDLGFDADIQTVYGFGYELIINDSDNG